MQKPYIDEKSDIEQDINDRFAAARQEVAATIAGHQLALAGQFLEAELNSYGTMKAIPDQSAVRVVGPRFVQGLERFPDAARVVARRAGNGVAGRYVEGLATRIASFGASPVLVANFDDLQTLPPDGGDSGGGSGGIDPPPPPPPDPILPSPIEPAVVEPAIPFDQLPQEARDLAQAQWDAHVGPEAQFLIDSAMATIQGGGGGGISISDLSGQITAFAMGAAASIGGPAGIALAGLAWILIPRMLAQFEDWLVGQALENGGI